MSTMIKLLNAFQENLNNWVCSYCNSGSGQPAATFREIKKLGYVFEENSPNRWGKNIYCHKCGNKRTHYKLLNTNPEIASKPRISINQSTRIRILEIFKGKDAFTGATISSTPEIDHKVPWTRLDEDIDAASLSDEAIIEHFQLLTREHNLLKDRACGSCKKEKIRPAFFGIKFWYEGNDEYLESCTGCGWHDGIEWREKINEEIKKWDT